MSDLQAAFQVTPPAGGLDGHMLVIFAIMLVAGALGGAANYFLADRPADGGRRPWLRYPVLGVVTALTVPLFLNMISSTLLEGARTKPLDLYVFAGFCLLYVIASRRLMDNMVERLRTQLDQVRKDMGKLEQENREAAQKPREEPEAPVEVKPDPKEVLSFHDIEILRLLADQSVVCGNLAPVSEQTGLERNFVSQRLSVMKNLGLIETRINEHSVLHWYVSSRGRQILVGILTGQAEKATA